MTTHSPWGKTLIRLLCGLAVLLTISSAALAQPTCTVTKLVLKSDVLGEERTVLVRTPVGYETNKLIYPNAAIYKANYERVHAKVKESTKKQ